MNRAVFIDYTRAALVGWTGRVTMWRHSDLCEPGRWFVTHSDDLDEVHRFFELGRASFHCASAVVDDFGDLVRVPT